MIEPVLTVKFFRTRGGTEPVRDWLMELSKADRKSILLHGFIKKSQAIPKEDLDVAKARLKQVRS